MKNIPPLRKLHQMAQIKKFSIFIIAFSIIAFCSGCKKIAEKMTNAYLENAAVEIVNNLVDVECTEVEIVKKIESGRWSAVAYFANGQTRHCIIECPFVDPPNGDYQKYQTNEVRVYLVP